MKLINVTDKDKSSTILKYDHTYPENDVYFSRKDEYTTEISDVNNFKKIMEELDFIIAYEDIKKKLSIIINQKYKLTLYSTNNQIYEIEIITLDGHNFVQEEFYELKDVLKEYAISVDEEGTWG